MVEVSGARRTTARRAAFCVERSFEEPYVKEEPSARAIRRLAGGTAISLAFIKEVPARTSTLKFSTTSPSSWNTCCPRVKESLVSPKTFSGNEIYNKFFQSRGQSFISGEERSMVLYAVAAREVIL